MMPQMTVEEYIKKQKQDLEERRQLAKDDPERARREALDRLYRAGIVDKNGELMPQYRNEPG